MTGSWHETIISTADRARDCGARQARRDRLRRAMSRPRLAFHTWPAAVYAIGDVHGCLDQLKALEAEIAEDGLNFEGEKWLVTVGDHVDRGPESQGAIGHVMGPAPAGFRRVRRAESRSNVRWTWRFCGYKEPISASPFGVQSRVLGEAASHQRCGRNGLAEPGRAGWSERRDRVWFHYARHDPDLDRGRRQPGS